MKRLQCNSLFTVKLTFIVSVASILTSYVQVYSSSSISETKHHYECFIDNTVHDARVMQGSQLIAWKVLSSKFV